MPSISNFVKMDGSKRYVKCEGRLCYLTEDLPTAPDHLQHYKRTPILHNHSLYQELNTTSQSLSPIPQPKVIHRRKLVSYCWMGNSANLKDTKVKEEFSLLSTWKTVTTHQTRCHQLISFYHESFSTTFVTIVSHDSNCSPQIY